MLPDELQAGLDRIARERERMAREKKPVRVGTILYGYTGGWFGESWDDKRVEAIGADWVVARDESGRVFFADVPPEKLEEYTVKTQD